MDRFCDLNFCFKVDQTSDFDMRVCLMLLVSDCVFRSSSIDQEAGLESFKHLETVKISLGYQLNPFYTISNNYVDKKI